MFTLIVPATELWDEEKLEFVSGSKEYKLQLEHSLVSLSKWESKYHKPFLTRNERTLDEIIDYVKCMTITQNVPDDVYKRITKPMLVQISEYIDNDMTATTFAPEIGGGKRNNEQITAELIYYWMFSLNIPMDCQKWHLNKLITLIRVSSIKNSPPKKMSTREILSRNAALNEARKRQLNTTG